MAGTDREVKREWSGHEVSETGTPEAAMKAMVEEFNALVDRFDALLAKLDADGGITDTDYAATIDDDSYSKLNVNN